MSLFFSALDRGRGRSLPETSSRAARTQETVGGAVANAESGVLSVRDFRHFLPPMQPLERNRRAKLRFAASADG